jgi:hypothetical protein
LTASTFNLCNTDSRLSSHIFLDYWYAFVPRNSAKAHFSTPDTDFAMAFEWLAPILTPTALRSVQADPHPVITLFIVIFGLSIFGALIWYIDFETSKAYPKKVDPKKKKGGLLGFLKK